MFEWKINWIKSKIYYFIYHCFLTNVACLSNCKHFTVYLVKRNKLHGVWYFFKY